MNNASFPTQGPGFDECTGTSMAAPLVTGALGIARSINPLLTKSVLLGHINSTSRTIAGQYKMPDVMAANIAVRATNGHLTPLFAMMVVGIGAAWNNFYTVAPQMAMAAYWGTMLPVSSGGTYYFSDWNANPHWSYTQFPETLFLSAPRAYVFVYTSDRVNGFNMLPLYRLSKLQNIGNGTDECGFPAPAKAVPVIHTYTTSLAERSVLMSPTGGNCYRFDGIEGYVYTQPAAGHEALYRVYNATMDNFMLIPSSRLAMANALNYVINPTILGYVVPN